MKNVAVILAGGTGQRLGTVIPKQFLKVAGKSVIEHTLEVFEKNPNIDEIAIVSHANFIREIEELVIENQLKKVKKILCGGEERYHSSLSAINAYSDDENVNLIFHDSVRPLVTDRIINDCISALNTYGAVDVAIPTTDTVIQVENNFIESIPNRNKLQNGQTPQAFSLGVIKKAYEIALKDPNFITTDDCGVVKKYLPDEKIYVVKGEQFNLKLTYKEDIFLLDKLFQLKSSSFKKESLATNCLNNKVMVIFGGTEGIGEAIVVMAKELGAKVYAVSRREGVDITDAESVKQALEIAFLHNGKIDYVINTAAILDQQPLDSMSYDDIARSIHVNYMGAIIVSKEAMDYLKQSKGMLLQFTSSSYTRGRMMYSIYSSCKAAIVNLVQALSEEWNEYGIRVNCINPERTKTPMRVKSFGQEPEDTLLTADEVALYTIKTLLSKITGQVIDVKRN